MKCQSLVSGKKIKNISKCCLLECLHCMQSAKQYRFLSFCLFSTARLYFACNQTVHSGEKIRMLSADIFTQKVLIIVSYLS